MLRSLIPDELLKVLLVNCSYQYDRYRELLTKYEFFEHMTFRVGQQYPRAFLDGLNVYNIKAFGTSEGLLEFKRSEPNSNKILKQLILDYSYLPSSIKGQCEK